MSPWLCQRIHADQSPDHFQQYKADLKRMKSNVGENCGTDRIEEVVRNLAGVHPTNLVAHISNQNEERADKRSDLPRQRNIHRQLLYGGIGSKLRHDSCHRDGQWTVKRTTTGASVAAAAELLGYFRHIQLSFAA